MNARHPHRFDMDKRLDHALSHGGTPEVPEGLEARIVAEVTKLPQDSRHSDEIPQSAPTEPTALEGRRRRLAFLGLAATVAGICASAFLFLNEAGPADETLRIASAPAQPANQRAAKAAIPEAASASFLNETEPAGQTPRIASAPAQPANQRTAKAGIPEAASAAKEPDTQTSAPVSEDQLLADRRASAGGRRASEESPSPGNGQSSDAPSKNATVLASEDTGLGQTEPAIDPASQDMEIAGPTRSRRVLAGESDTDGPVAGLPTVPKYGIVGGSSQPEIFPQGEWRTDLPSRPSPRRR